MSVNMSKSATGNKRNITSGRTSVDNIKIVDMTPNVKNAALQKYLPTVLFPQRISFEVSPVSNAVSNAIRRTVACELPVWRMSTEYANVTTNDAFIIPEMVIQRLRMIPVDQTISVGTTFDIAASNNLTYERDVKSSEMQTKGRSGLPFNGTYTLFTLKPGKTIKITNIKLESAHGFEPGYGMHTVAVNASSVAVDQIPINTFEKDLGGGIPSSMSDPRKWKVSFTTNGDMHPKAIVIAACNNIILRVQAVQDILQSMTTSTDEYNLVIPGENHTVGNLLMRTILDLYPDILAVVYTPGNLERTCTMRVRCDDDINDVYTSAIKHIVKTFSEIKNAVNN